MKTIEIAARNWPEFCRQLAEICRDSLITIERQRPDGSTDTPVRNSPLRGLVLDDRSDPCNTNFIIETGERDQKPSRHVIIEPIHIRLKDGADNQRYTQVQLTSEEGTTVLTLRPGLTAQAAIMLAE